MGKKHGRKKRIDGVAVEAKLNVRLFLAHDVIWMLLGDEERERVFSSERATSRELEVTTEVGLDKDGDIAYAKHSWDLPSIADKLGFDKAEIVLDPYGNRQVLLYNVGRVVF